MTSNIQPKPSLSIVITTFNSSKVILNCLSKINLQKYPVFIVDNNSSDNTLKIVEENFPNQITIIKNSKNLGYGRGNNCALKLVKTPFAMILNPDAFIFDDDISIILNLLYNNPRIAIGAPLILKKYPFDQADYNQEIDVVNHNLIHDFENFKSVKYIIGACLILRMEFFKQRGFYDEKIFLYYEDDEICNRAIKLNQICAIIPQAKAYHIGHGSSGDSFRNLYRRYWHRSLSKFYWKEKQKGLCEANISALKLAFSYLIRGLFYALTFNRKNFIKNLASLNGTIAYLARLSAFDKNDNPRG